LGCYRCRGGGELQQGRKLAHTGVCSGILLQLERVCKENWRSIGDNGSIWLDNKQHVQYAIITASILVVTRISPKNNFRSNFA